MEKQEKMSELLKEILNILDEILARENENEKKYYQKYREIISSQYEMSVQRIMPCSEGRRSGILRSLSEICGYDYENLWIAVKNAENFYEKECYYWDKKSPERSILIEKEQAINIVNKTFDYGIITKECRDEKIKKIYECKDEDWDNLLL